jgi:NAD(P)-dependent dehydrogenase (short-subunit alcohol dehydrogenase family)
VTDRFLAGRHAVVTGGGKGLGAAIAHALAAAGAGITILGRDADALAVTADAIQSRHGVPAHAQPADITASGDLDAVFAAARERLGDPWILINNAGIAESAPFVATSRALWDRTFAVNVTAAFACTQQVLRAMLETGGGRIVNVASTAGLRGVARVAAYAASKHALIGLTRSLALEVARQSITVNAVCPGYTDTAMAERAVAAIASRGDRTREEAERLLARPSAFGRLIQPVEVAGVVAWLCSPDAATVTGQAIVIGGDVT